MLFSSIIIVMLTGTLIAIILKAPKKALVFLISAIFSFYLAVSGLLPQLLLSYLEIYSRQDSPEWKQNNVIVLLGGGVIPWEKDNAFKTNPLALSRVFEAARLYSLCSQLKRQCKIVTSGGDPLFFGKSEAEVMKEELLLFGIPPQDIHQEDQSRNTIENARFTAPIIRGHKFDQVFVVTSGFHMRRSLILFSRHGLQAIAAPSERIRPGRTFFPKTKNLYWTELALHEYGGILQLYMLSFLDI